MTDDDIFDDQSGPVRTPKNRKKASKVNEETPSPEQAPRMKKRVKNVNPFSTKKKKGTLRRTSSSGGVFQVTPLIFPPL